MLKRFFLSVVLCGIISISYSQIDTSFWFAAPALTITNGNSPIYIRLSSFGSPAQVVISEPANPNFVPYTVNLPAYGAQTVDLTAQLGIVENKPVATVLNYGIHIKSTSNIAAYYEEDSPNNPEIFPLKGKSGQGMNFIIPAQTTFGDWAYTPNPPAHNGFILVASQDNTSITFTLTQPSGNYAANTPYTIVLNKGQSYAVIANGTLASGHLGGSTVQSNKPINITTFDDSVDASTVCASCTCKDLVGDQIVPVETTGQEFIIIKGDLSVPPSSGDYYYVWPTQDSTNIFVNGTQVASNVMKGQSWGGYLGAPSAFIQTSNNAYVYQLTGTGCEMAATDLPSITCTGSQLVTFVRSTNEYFQLNLLCKAADIGNFLVNNSFPIPSNLFQAVPGTNGAWMAARINSSNLNTINSLFQVGAALVVSNSTGLFHLGFLNGGSTSGSRLGYFSNYSTVQTSPSITSTSCLGSNIQLNSTLITGASYSWTGPNGFNSTIYNPVITKASSQSSGTYYLTTNINGCGISYDSVTVNVHPLPTIQFLKSLDTVCYGNSKNISLALTGTAPWSLIYNNGSANDTIPVVSQSPSFFTVKPTVNTIYTMIGITDSNSCTIDSTISFPLDTLIVNPLPVPGFKLTSLSCAGNAVTFTDSSTAGLDPIVNWYWIMGNDSIRNVTVDSSFNEVYPVWGNYTVQLAEQSSMGCKSDTLSKSILVHPLPTVAFGIPQVCLNDASAVFTDSTTLVDSSKPYSFQWNFNAATASPTVPLANYPVPLSSTNQNPSIHYRAASNYFVQETVTSVNGCVDSLTKSFTVNGANPIAVFSLLDSMRLCSNQPVSVQNLSTVDFGTITRTEIIWSATADSIDNTPDSGKVYQYKYTNFQQPSIVSDTLKLIAFSGITCADTISSIVSLHQSPQVLFQVLPGICNDTIPRQITQASETGGVPGTFIYSGSGIDSAGIYFPRQVQAGTYPIKAVYTSAFGCSDSAVQTQTVWPSPVAKWGVSSPNCALNNITFTDSSVANYSLISQRFWNFGDGTTAINTSAASFLKQYAAANVYMVNLQVITDSGCISKSDSQAITVHYLPVVGFGIPSICLPDGQGQFTDSTTIADNTQSLFTYVWNFGDPNNPATSLLKNPVHQYSALGPYMVELIVTSKYGCVDSLKQQISTIYPQPKANFGIQPAEICMGDSIHFYDSTSGYTGSITSWNWNLAENYTSTLQNPFRQFADSGRFNISLFIYDSKNCVSDTALKTVIVDPYPHLSLVNHIFVLQGASVKLIPDFFANNATFNWTPVLYLDSANVAYPITKPLENITYQLTLTGQGNCSVSDTIFVQVLPTPIIPNAFSPNGDGINDTWIIKALDNYPECDVQVFDRNGQTVFKSVGYSIPWDGTFNGTPLPVGTYYYIVNPKHGRSLMSGSVTIIR